MAPAPTYVFGPYRLDAQHRRLDRGDRPVVLNDRLIEILLQLVAAAGHIVTKDALIAAAWKDVAVTDNSLTQAISSLRRVLGASPEGPPYIETVARRGYRFSGAVELHVSRETDDALAARLEPYRAFVEGRAAMETLDRAAIGRAIEVFTRVVTAAPDDAPAHLGLANAQAMAFDATRFSRTPDVAALEQASRHAWEACRLDPDAGEPWATLCFVLSRAGADADAVAAGRRATALDPENWRHHIRLAYAAWGDERLRAARAALHQLPGLGLAHWLAATVFVARQAFGDARRELLLGAAAQDAQPAGGRFGAVGLHGLLGLVCNAQGDRPGAEREISRELSFEPSGHIYSAPACASAWYAVGALRLDADQTADAMAAFLQALERAPGHPMALAAMAGLARGSTRATWRKRFDECTTHMEARGAYVDAAAALAVEDVLKNRPALAARRVLAAFARQSTGSSAGWGIPIDPLLHPWRAPDAWQAVLAAVGGRAA